MAIHYALRIFVWQSFCMTPCMMTTVHGLSFRSRANEDGLVAHLAQLARLEIELRLAEMRRPVAEHRDTLAA